MVRGEPWYRIELEGTGRLEWESFIRLLAAAGFAGAIGLDRELRAKPAGLRTNIVVGVAAGAFAYAGLNAFPAGDPSRVAAQIVSGIGFLGGGAIFAAGGKPHGLTTAAALWGSAAAGLAAGVGAYATGLALVAVTVFALWPLDRAANSLLAARRRSNVRIAVVLRDLGGASRARALLAEAGIGVDQLEMRPFGDLGVAMELVVQGTRAHLAEAVGRLRLLEEVLFVSEEAVPRDERAGLRARRQGRHGSYLQASLALPAQNDLPRPTRRRRRGARSGGETSWRPHGQRPHASQRCQQEAGKDAGCSRSWTATRALESNHRTPVPDDARSSDQSRNMARESCFFGDNPFSHLREAGMKRLSEAHAWALLQDLAVDLWDPPSGLLLHQAAPDRARFVLGGFRVYDIVPRRFQAYARIFHPLHDRTTADAIPARARLSDVLTGSPQGIDADGHPARVRATAAHGELEPLIGVLDRPTAVNLADVLKRHTKTPGAVYFLFRAGLAAFGDQQRNVIYQAPIDLVGSFYRCGRQTYLSPTLWWDAGGQWFVATHPDSSSTYLGGSRLLVRELSTTKRIEAVEVEPRAFVDVSLG